MKGINGSGGWSLPDKKSALILMSAVFFWWPITLFLLLVFPYSGSYLWIAVLIPAGLVSFAGSIFLMEGEKTRSVRRYLIIPFCLDTLAVLIAGAVSFYISESFPDGTGAMIWASALLMLAPCSAAVFFSLPTGGFIRSASVFAATFISAYSILTTIFLFHATYEPTLGLLYIYWLLGMPIIGLSYLANSIVSPDKPSERHQ